MSAIIEVFQMLAC